MTLQINHFSGRPGVRFPLEPQEDESLPGYLARVAAWNVLEGPRAILRKVGVQKVTDLADKVAAHAGELAQELGISQSALLRMTILGTASPDTEVSFFGMPLPRGFLRVKARHVAPASLRLSNHHRATWQVSLITWCAETWDPLIDACPSCGHDLNFETKLGVEYCQACDFNLEVADVVPIPVEHRPYLKVVSDLASPRMEVRARAAEPLPSPFRELSSNALLALVSATARALRSRRSAALAPSEVAAAVRALMEYPSSFERICDANTDRSSSFFGRLKESTLLLNYPELDRISPEILDRFAPPSRTRKAMMRQREEEGLLTARIAAAKLGLTRSQLLRLLQAGEFRQVSGWYQPGQVEAAAARLANRVSLTRLEKQFGLPRCGTEQLISLGLLKANTDPMVARLFPGLQVDRSSLEDLLAKLGFAVGLPSVREPPATLVDAFRAIGGQEKPWGSVVHAHVTRKVVGGLTHEPNEPFRFSSLTVTPEFARQLASGACPELLAIPPRISDLGPLPPFTRTEVEHYLNCFPRDVAWLIQAGHLEPCGATRLFFAREQVVALGNTLISSREIIWRWRVSPELRERLHREGIVRRSLGPFWPRAEITAHFATLLPKGVPI